MRASVRVCVCVCVCVCVREGRSHVSTVGANVGERVGAAVLPDAAAAAGVRRTSYGGYNGAASPGSEPKP